MTYKKTLEKVKFALNDRKPRQQGKEIKFICPSHAEDEPSASLNTEKETWYCFGCGDSGGIKDLARKLDIKIEEPPRQNTQHDNTTCNDLDFMLLPPGIASEHDGLQQTQLWEYKDVLGVTTGYTVRYDNGSKKNIIPYFRKKNEEWHKGAQRTPRQLYALDLLALRREETVWIVEGEKCAEALIKIGALATTSQGGANAANKTDWSPLNDDRTIIIWPDNDAPGKRYAQTIYATINDSNRAKIIDVEKLGLQPGEDAYDWIAKNGITDKEALKTLPALEADEIDDNKWASELLKDSKGAPSKSPGNALMIVKNLAGLKGLFVTNARSKQKRLQKCPPWENAETFKPRGVADSDYAYCELYIEQQTALYFSLKTITEAVDAVSKSNEVDPVKQYFNGLKWDGKKRIDTWLTDYCQADDSDYTREIGAKFLISAVARTYQPGCQVDTMLVMQGAQGIKKSSLLRVLAGEENFTDQLSDISSKDARLELHGPLIVEVAEMHRFSKKEMSAINAYLTSRVDKIRPPYGRNVVEMPRRCVFAGTVNQDMFLRDETGGRRFWPVSVKEIDLDSVKRDRDQLWAEAVARYKSGERWYLTGAVELESKKIQDTRRQTDPWESPIVDYLRTKRNGLKTQNMTDDEIGALDVMFDAMGNRAMTTTDELLTHAIDIPVYQRNQSHSMRVAGILKAIKYTYKRIILNGKKARVFVPPPDWAMADFGLDYDF